MNKVAEFYAKVMADEATEKEFMEAMSDKAMNELGDAEFDKLGKLAEKLGFTISVEEAKEYLGTKEGELADDELDTVAGGTSAEKYAASRREALEAQFGGQETKLCPYCQQELKVSGYCTNCHKPIE